MPLPLSTGPQWHAAMGSAAPLRRQQPLQQQQPQQPQPQQQPKHHRHPQAWGASCSSSSAAATSPTGRMMRTVAAASAAAAFPLQPDAHSSHQHLHSVFGGGSGDAHSDVMSSRPAQKQQQQQQQQQQWQQQQHEAHHTNSSSSSSSSSNAGSPAAASVAAAMSAAPAVAVPAIDALAPVLCPAAPGATEIALLSYDAAAAAAAAAAVPGWQTTSFIRESVEQAMQGEGLARTTTAGSSGSVSVHALTKHIQSCSTADALQQLLQQQEGQLDHVHVSAAFVQLARLHRCQHQQHQQQQQQQQHQQQLDVIVVVPLLRQLEQAAVAQLPRLQSRHTSNILWACACLGFRPSALVLQALLGRAQEQLQAGTTPQGFANTLWALASLQAPPGDAWMDAFFAASQRHLAVFRPQELSSVIWALAQLRLAPPPSWHGAFLAAAAPQLGAASSQALSNLMWGLARLQLAVPGDLWAAATYACTLRAAEFTPAGLSQLFWAAGMLAGRQQRRQQQQQQEQQLSLVAAGSAFGATTTTISSSSSSGHTDWLQPLLAAAEQHLPQYTCSALANMLWALAVLDCQPQQQFLDACTARLAQEATLLTPASAATAFWAISKLSCGSAGGAAPAAAGVLLPLVHRLQQQLGACNAQHCVYVAAAIAHTRQQQQHGDAEAAVLSGSLCQLEQELLTVCEQQLPSFGIAQLCQLARWLAAGGSRPPEPWVHAFLAAASRQLPSMQPSQQLLLLHALAHWRVQPQAGWCALFLAAVSAQQACARYSAAHVGALLQALAAAGVQPTQQQLQALLQHVLVAADTSRQPAACAAVLSGLCSLGFRPADGWVQRFWALSTGALAAGAADGAALAALAAVLQLPAVAQLSLRPTKPFAAAYQAALSAALPQLQPQQAAVVLASLGALHLQPTPTQQQQELQDGEQSNDSSRQLLLPALMAAAARGMYAMPLEQVIGAWWGLVELRVLEQPVSLQQLHAPPGAEGQQQAQQGLQDLQRQWQAVWLRRIFGSSSGGGAVAAAAPLAGLPVAPLLQLAQCLGRLQQAAPAAWAAEYVAAVSARLPELAPHQLHALLCALPALGGAAAWPQLAGQLLERLQPVLGQLTPGQLSRALAAAHEAGAKPPERWLRAYVSAASGSLHAFTPRHLIRMLLAMARLRFVPTPAFLAAATEAAVASLSRFRLAPAAFVDLLWALTALRVRPTAAWMARFEARLLERGPQRLDGQQLSRLGWCLAALQRRPGRVLMARWLAAVQDALPAMDGSSLVDALWSCAMLDEQPSHAWMCAFMAASKQQLGGLSSSSLVTLVWALALLQQRPASDWMQPCLAALARCLDATCTAAAAAAAAGESTQHVQVQQQQQSLQPLGPEQVTRVTWALAALDCQLPPSISGQLLQLSVPAVQHMAHDLDGLAQLMWAWDRLDETPSKQHVRALAAAARAQLLPQSDADADADAGSSERAGDVPAEQPVLLQSHALQQQQQQLKRRQVALLRPSTTLLPPARSTAAGLTVRLTRGRVLARPPQQQQQQHQEEEVGAARVQELAAAAAARGVLPNPEFAAALRHVQLAGSSRQQHFGRLRQQQQQQQCADSTR